MIPIHAGHAWDDTSSDTVPPAFLSLRRGSARRARMDWMAPVYDRLMGRLERRALQSWRQRAWAEVPDGGVGLEIGAGTGANVPFYAEAPFVVASDVSVRMLREAKRKGDRAWVPLIACDAQALPFDDAAFDWVAETLVFCEVPDPVAGLREIRRVLKRDGRVVMLEHVRPSGWLGLAADAATAITAPVLGEHFNRNAEAAVEEAGLEVERREWIWRDAVVLLVARRGEA